VDRAKVHAGQTVLVHAGAGGVGFAAVQIALAFGAKVYATVSPDKRALIEEVGAISIDRNQTVEAYVQDRTAGEGFDIIYDTLGGKCWMPLSPQSNAIRDMWSAASDGEHTRSRRSPFAQPPIQECSRFFLC
jgi:NADPH:quinone reductase-like Zn-dependent oxidoreductase